jgi:hypothetical protein
MNRFLAFICALFFAFVSVSSACTAAQPSAWMQFTLAPERGSRGEIQADFRSYSRENESHWSDGFMPAQLVGLDTAGFYGAGARPLRFAVIREAGRLDCAGQGGSAHAWGNCSFTQNAAFMQALVNRGIARPSREEAFSLMALDVRRDLVDAIAAARYPTPTVNQLVELRALDVTRRYIAELAATGYRPRTLQTLVEFKALGISPEWIRGFARIGYANIPSDQLVQLKAMDITPDFITGFAQVGYRNLPVDQLVQLKALGVTPEFARRVVGQSGSRPPVNELVDTKIFGRRH